MQLSHNSIDPAAQEMPTLQPDTLTCSWLWAFSPERPPGLTLSLTSSCKLRSKLRPSREEEIRGNPSLGVWKMLDDHQRFSVSLPSLGLVGDTPSAHQPRQVCAVALSDRGPNGL